jgi:nucleotide-binding universal stress UspA family protein
VLLVHVFDGPFMLPRELTRQPSAAETAARVKEVEAKLRRLAETLDNNGVQRECIAVHGVARDEVPRLAEQHHAALIVMGSHGQGTSGGYFLGSVADAIVRSAPVPVLIVRGDAQPWTADVSPADGTQPLAHRRGSPVASPINASPTLRPQGS